MPSADVESTLPSSESQQPSIVSLSDEEIVKDDETDEDNRDTESSLLRLSRSDSGSEQVNSRSAKKRKLSPSLNTASFLYARECEVETLVAAMTNHEPNVEAKLLETLKKKPHLASCTYNIACFNGTIQKAYPLFHFSQFSSLASVVAVYSLYPRAIAATTMSMTRSIRDCEKKECFTPHHFAAANINDDVLRFLIYQHPKALAHKLPISVLFMLCERIQSLELIKFCLHFFPKGLHDTDEKGNTLLHKACCRIQTVEDNVNGSFSSSICKGSVYNGARPQLIKYLIEKHPKLCEIPNYEGNLPLHLLLEQPPPPALSLAIQGNDTNVVTNSATIFDSAVSITSIPTTSAIILIENYPKSLEISNAAGLLPLELAIEAGASNDLVAAMGGYIKEIDSPEDILGQESALKVHLSSHQLSGSQQHLVQVRIWDSGICPPLARAISCILKTNSSVKQLTVAFTRFECSGMICLLKALERNTCVLQCILSSNIGYYAQQVVGLPLRLVSDEEERELASTLTKVLTHNRTMTLLDLSDNVLPYSDSSWLEPLICKNRTLLGLNLSRTTAETRILKVGIILNILQQNNTLQELILPRFQDDDESVLKILQILKLENTTLQRIVFGSSVPTVQTLKASRDALHYNANLLDIQFGGWHAVQAQEAISLEDDAKISTLLSLWNDVDHEAKVNRAGRQKLRDGTHRKDIFVKSLPADLSTVYTLLREAPQLWSTVQ